MSHMNRQYCIVICPIEYSTIFFLHQYKIMGKHIKVTKIPFSAGERSKYKANLLDLWWHLTVLLLCWGPCILLWHLHLITALKIFLSFPPRLNSEEHKMVFLWHRNGWGCLRAPIHPVFVHLCSLSTILKRMIQKHLSLKNRLKHHHPVSPLQTHLLCSLCFHFREIGHWECNFQVHCMSLSLKGPSFISSETCN